MSDKYQSFTQSPLGKILVKNLGLPAPTPLERYTAGDPLVDGTVVVGGTGRLVESLPGLLDTVGIASTVVTEDGQKYKGLVFDATGLTSADQLVALQQFFTPLMRSLASCPRVVVIGTPPEQCSGSERVAQRALEGFTRSLGKEIGRGGTSQLVYVAEGAEGAATSTLAFLLSPKSAYVSGQVVRIGATGTTKAAAVADWQQPLAGKVALVTGASRGIGEQIARVLHRDGATVVGVDVPQAANELQSLMKELDGDWLTLDITAKDAPQRIAHHLSTKHGGVDVVVHNAGITRDKKLANMGEDRWESVIAVNLTAPERITRELLDQKVINKGGSIVGVASIAGIAGNVGQTNYAASKAGLVGMARSIARELGSRSITANVVAPGFIETDMTAVLSDEQKDTIKSQVPLQRYGTTDEIASTVLWLTGPGATYVTGAVIPVDGGLGMGH